MFLKDETLVIFLTNFPYVIFRDSLTVSLFCVNKQNIYLGKKKDKREHLNFSETDAKLS